MTRRQRRPRVWVVPSTGARPRHPLIPCRKSSSRSGVARCVVLCYYMGERSARGVGDVCPVVIWWLLGRSTATSTSSSDISITGRSCWKIDIFRPYIDVTSKAGNCLPCVCGVLLCFFIIISTQCLRRKYCSVIQKKLENVAIANALQLEAGGARPNVSRSPMRRLCKLWSRSTCPFLSYSVYTADALRYAATLTFDLKHWFVTFGRWPWTFVVYIGCDVVKLCTKF